MTEAVAQLIRFPNAAQPQVLGGLGACAVVQAIALCKAAASASLSRFEVLQVLAAARDALRAAVARHDIGDVARMNLRILADEIGRFDDSICDLDRHGIELQVVQLAKALSSVLTASREARHYAS